MLDRSDESLYLALLAGELGAFDELYRRYEAPLFGFILRQLADHAEAEDVFHEAFIAVLKERRSARELESFRAWLFQVARNLCRNRMRGRKRAARALDTELRSVVEPVVHADEPSDRGEAPIALERAVATLPEPLAQVYALRVSGLSYDEIARVLEVPLGTVKSRIHDMVSRLKKEIRAWTAS